MKEQLKQAIEENLNKHRHETILNFEGYKKRVDWILQDQSILRHADPEIMKQAGWVREYLPCENCGGGHVRPCNHCCDSGQYKLMYSLKEMNEIRRTDVIRAFSLFGENPLLDPDFSYYINKFHPLEKLPNPPKQ